MAFLALGILARGFDSGFLLIGIGSDFKSRYTPVQDLPAPTRLPSG
jgi:hypothetical protein